MNYRLRDCEVRRDAQGRTRLTFAAGNLLPLEGVVFDDGPVVRFAGWLTEPTTLIDCDGCQQQVIHGVFRSNGANLRGLITFSNHYDAHSPTTPPDANVKIEEAIDRYPVELKFRRALRRPGLDAEP